jgi:DNA-binding transcriptional ArsR family regulator
MKAITKKRLTCTMYARTLYEVIRTMDATSRQLIDTLADLRRKIADLERQADAIKTVLESLGYRQPILDRMWGDALDVKYAKEQPFTHCSLVDACMKIFAAQRITDYLTKSQVEYLAVVGGFPFSTKNRKNSVDVTLRRLAEQEALEVERVGGHVGNRYRLPLSFWKGSMRDDLYESVVRKDKEDAEERRKQDAASTKAGAE